MRKVVLTSITVLCLCMWMTGDVLGRGGRGGGGGGRGGGGGAARGGMGGGGYRGGGGGGRSAAARTPSMSRSAGMSRPSGGGRPSGGYAGARPSGGTRPSGGQISRPQGNRSQLGSLPTPNRPGSGISQRPGGGPNVAQRPGGSRPNFAAGGGRPTQGQLNDFLDLGGSGSRPSVSRPSSPGRGGSDRVAGGAAAEFLKDRPSTSRPSDGVRPATFERPSVATRPGRPGPGDLAGGGRPGRPGDGFRPGDGTRPVRPGDGDRPGRPGNRPGDRPEWANRPHHRPDRNPDWDRWQNWRHEEWRNVNNYWNNHWGNYRRYFDGDWCHHHPYWHWRPGFNYWAWATWPAVVGWFPWGWSQPVYYNYGSNVYYQDDMVYYGDTPVATAADYAYQAEQIATSVPADPPPADSWMSLGVFAVIPDDGSGGTDPTMFLQLAVSKDGVIAGTLQNTVTGTTKNIEGMVDRETQRAAWTEVGQTRPIMETGIGNLTQDTAATLVHFADGTTQQWLLVRMDAPPGDGTSGSGSTSRTPPQ